MQTRGAQTWILCLLLAAGTALATPSMRQPERPSGSPRLILDAAPERCLPKSFRTSAQLAKAYPGDRGGLAELRASGSASFTQKELALMQQSFTGPAVIVDLRQESHAMLNGVPVTWYAPSDWDNVGRTNDQVRQLEPEQLADVPASLKLSPDKEDDEGISTPVQLEVRSRQSEQELVEGMGLGYFRLYVTDHLRPRDEEVDRFLDFVDLLPTGTWLHFHCRGGKGRTTTFLAMYDMLRNAPQVDFQEIVKRQMALPPTYDLLAERNHSPRAPYYKERAEFVGRFYQFARQRRNGQSWSSWVQSHWCSMPLN